MSPRSTTRATRKTRRPERTSRPATAWPSSHRTEVYILPGVRVEHTVGRLRGQRRANSRRTAPGSPRRRSRHELTRTCCRASMSATRSPTTRTPGRRHPHACAAELHQPDSVRARSTIRRTRSRSAMPTSADATWNVDVMVERYLKSVGIISGGVFYKQLKDYIYTFTSNEMINNETFTVTQPLNGEAASIRGLELVAQSQLVPAQAVQRHRRLRELHVHRFERGIPRADRRAVDAARPVAARRQSRRLLRTVRVLRPRRGELSRRRTSIRSVGLRPGSVLRHAHAGGHLAEPADPASPRRTSTSST